MSYLRALFVGLLLCLACQSQALADEKKSQAVKDFTTITVPNIQLMAPYIAKSADERRAAFADIDAKTHNCYSAFNSAYEAKEDLAYDAVEVCLALRYWMNDIDSMVCDDLKPPHDRDLFPLRGDGKIKRGFKAAQIETVYNALQDAAGCKTKTPAFWSQHAIDDYVAMDKLLYGVEKADLASIQPRIEILQDRCYGADAMSGTYSKLAESAHWGCAAIVLYARNNGTDPCFSWYMARDTSKSVPESDPFYDQVLPLRVSYHTLSEQTGCEAAVRAYFEQYGAAEAQAAEDAKTQAEFDGYMNTYTYEREQADSYLVLTNAWEDRAIQYVANGVGRSESLDSSVCDYYKYTREHVYNAQVAAANMYQLRPTDANKSRAETEQRNRAFLDDRVQAWCK